MFTFDISYTAGTCFPRDLKYVQVENKLYFLQHQHQNPPIAQRAGIRVGFLAYSSDMMRQKTAR